jgi:hypothetical protein
MNVIIILTSIMIIKGFLFLKISIFKGSILFSKEENEQKDPLDWYNIFKFGILIKQSPVSNKHIFDKYEGLFDEMTFVTNDIFNNLKGIYITKMILILKHLEMYFFFMLNLTILLLFLLF